MKLSVILKIGCIIIFVFDICLALGGIVAHWRNIHNKPEELDIQGHKVSLLPNNPLPDKVEKKLGLLDNCADEDNNKCDWPDRSGFLGDKAIVSMLSVTVAVYLGCFIAMMISMFLQSFPPKALYFFPFFCFIGTVLITGSITLFLIYYNTVYVPYEGEGKKLLSLAGAVGATALYTNEDGVVMGPYTSKITYGDGFYISVGAVVLSLLSICVSTFAAYKNVKEEEEIEGECEVKVVKVDKVEPPSSE